MLFLLTGDVQIGKTRWLLSLVEDLTRAGVVCSGVVAPGDWVPDGNGGFEKLGIDNVLLPSGRRIRFARRQDLALEEGSYDPQSQSAMAGMHWEISEEALAEVNAHFDRLAECKEEGGAFGCAEAPELLVVDELGQLELKRGEGLISALGLVDAGTPPSCACVGAPKHCLVVVRDCLLPLAKEHFGDAWGQMAEIAPGDAARAAVLAAFE